SYATDKSRAVPMPTSMASTARTSRAGDGRRLSKVVEDRAPEGRAMKKQKTSSVSAKMGRKEFERELRKLQIELCKLQDWVKHKGLRVVLVFEGRDGAGKGGTIKAITERVSPRGFRVVALPAPSDVQKSQWYAQRYIPHLPAAGEVVIFDRSWYNRAGVETVLGFCTPKETERFL